MTGATFFVTAEPERDLIRIHLAGFLTQDGVTAFFKARNAAHRELRCGPNQHITIADVRGMAVQAQELVHRFQSMLADPAYRSRRLAIVTPSSLARMQVQRAAGNPHARFFTDPDEAEAWALEPEPPTS